MLLHVDLLGPVDHDLGYVVVCEQVLERPQPEHVVDDGLVDPLAILPAQGEGAGGSVRTS